MLKEYNSSQETYNSSQETAINYDYGEEIIQEDAQEIVYSGEEEKTSSQDYSSTNQQEAAVLVKYRKIPRIYLA